MYWVAFGNGFVVIHNFLLSLIILLPSPQSIVLLHSPLSPKVFGGFGNGLLHFDNRNSVLILPPNPHSTIFLFWSRQAIQFTRSSVALNIFISLPLGFYFVCASIKTWQQTRNNQHMDRQGKTMYSKYLANKLRGFVFGRPVNINVEAASKHQHAIGGLSMNFRREGGREGVVHATTSGGGVIFLCFFLIFSCC
jgi:hypothetical protein